MNHTNLKSQYIMTITIFVLLILFASPAQAETILYSYDPAGRVIKVEYQDSGVTVTYEYDAAGNILKRTVTKGTTGVSDISFSTNSINFASTTAGQMTSAQQFRISSSVGSTPVWSISDDAKWLSCTPTSGVGTAVITVSIDPTGLAAGTYRAIITITSPNAFNASHTIIVTLTVKKPSDATPPFGVFATPRDITTGIKGAIPVTGWVLDDIETTKVEIWRDAVNGEAPGQLFVGNAIFVEGARPDIEQLYPDYPLCNKAGWGFMMQTNFLPNQGNGTYNIHAFAYDKEENSALLGTKIIICDNANAIKPFGMIDIPSQGEVVFGSRFINLGWALAPKPNEIPKDGSTMDVYVDGKNLGHPTYNQYREDVAASFLGLQNTDGAEGFFYLDTTQFENGVHTIYWIAEDSAGNTDCIGTRYFTVLNTGTTSESQRKSTQGKNVSIPLSFESVMNLPISYEPVRYKRGFKADMDPEIAVTDNYGISSIEIREVEGIKIDLGKGEAYSGYLVVGTQLRPLPIGSTLDAEKGTFSWMPGPGFVGVYDFVFVKEDGNGVQPKISVRIRIKPKFDFF